MVKFYKVYQDVKPLMDEVKEASAKQAVAEAEKAKV